MTVFPTPFQFSAFQLSPTPSLIATILTENSIEARSGTTKFY